MVTQWIIQAFSSLWAWLINSIPAPEPPAWLSEGADFPSYLHEPLTWLEPWVPVTLLATIAGLILVTFLVSWSITVIRIVSSFFTLGGGM